MPIEFMGEPIPASDIVSRAAVPRLRSRARLPSTFDMALALPGSCNSETFGKQLPPYPYKLTARVGMPEGIISSGHAIEMQWRVPKIMRSRDNGRLRIGMKALSNAGKAG